MCDSWPVDVMLGVLRQTPDCRDVVRMCSISHACLQKCVSIYSFDPNAAVGEDEEKRVRRNMLWTCVTNMIDEMLQQPLPPIGYSWDVAHVNDVVGRNIADFRPDLVDALHDFVDIHDPHHNGTILLKPDEYGFISTIQEGVIRPNDFFIDRNNGDIAWVAQKPGWFSVVWTPTELYLQMLTHSDELVRLMKLAFTLKGARQFSYGPTLVFVTMPSLSRTRIAYRTRKQQMKHIRKEWILSFPFLKEGYIAADYEEYVPRTLDTTDFETRVRAL